MWYSTLTAMERVYFYLGVISTAVLLLQTILIFITGHGDVDMDTDVDTSIGISDGVDDVGLRMFSVRGILSFLCIGGWAGLVFSSTGWHSAIVALIAFIFGAAAFVGMAFLLKLIYKLQFDGTMDINDAVGKIGSVYTPIASQQEKMGKVTVEISGRLTEMDAVTENNRILKSGEKVKIVKLLTPNVLIVEPLNNGQKLNDTK